MSGRVRDLALAYARSLVSFWLGGPPSPFSAAYVVTNRCNLRCSYCDVPSLGSDDLDLPQIEHLFERLWRLGVRRLGLSGGEPTTRADFPRIVELARARGFFVSVNTNLLLYERRPEGVRAADLVFTSLDGDAETHARSRGDDAYERVLAAIRDLRRRGRRVVAITVVTPTTRPGVPALLATAEREGFLVHLQPQCFDAEVVRGRPEPGHDDLEARAFWREMLARKRSGAPIASSEAYLEAIVAWPDLRTTAIHDPDHRCGAGEAFLYVDHRGVAYPCAYTRGKVQGVPLLEADWREAWDRRLPCTRCIVGPYLEFSLLLHAPARSALAASRAYLLQRRSRSRRYQ